MHPEIMYEYARRRMDDEHRIAARQRIGRGEHWSLTDEEPDEEPILRRLATMTRRIAQRAVRSARPADGTP